jgi:hypothetical protein
MQDSSRQDTPNAFLLPMGPLRRTCARAGIFCLPLPTARKCDKDSTPGRKSRASPPQPKDDRPR